MKTMKTNFDPKYLTKSVTHCLKATCSLAESCLHSLVHRHLPPQSSYVCYDPRLQSDGETCPTYLSNRIIRMAKGFRTGIQRVPQKDAKKARQTIRYEMDWGVSTYYEYRSGKRALSPEQQVVISDILHRYSIEGELFDAYIEVYPSE
ncbi:DUF6078 family protein [Porphyromonas cangingivalis]|uniref:DUF6078 family protein n=1 Tax=Porphyromonas cangingivalis TaxID=36874 RepID=UPI000DD39426|nr:DUF6078 family protein [Porphyromonas cangingivalis]